MSFGGDYLRERVADLERASTERGREPGPALGAALEVMRMVADAFDVEQARTTLSSAEAEQADREKVASD